MPIIKLEFRPGVNRDATSYSGEGGWFVINLVRFQSGYPQKIGGWASSAIGYFYGVCRQMFSWITSYDDDLLFLGTNLKTYLEAGGNYYDITPLRATTPTMTTPNTNNCVNTLINSTTVTIKLGAVHTATTGNFVTLAGVAGPIGGISAASLNANFQITVLNATDFTIVVDTTATSTVVNSGGVAITISYEIDTGYAASTAGYGWGTGTWGRSTWGSGSVSPIYLPQQDWFADNLDNNLVFNLRNGAIYYWERGVISIPSTAFATRGVLLSSISGASDVPLEAMQTMVSQQDQHLLAFGCTTYGSTDFDPMLIRWSNQSDPGNWTPSPTNSSGFVRLSRGSMIVRALSTRQEILIWTDSNLYALQYLGTADVYGVQEYAGNISIMSPRACVSASDVTYWMGKNKFYSYSGTVNTLPCTLRQQVFSNFNYNQSDQVVCGTNERWNEIWWFYPSATATWNDSYVVYNHVEKIWYYGSLSRTAWLDTPLREYPLAAYTPESAITSGILYNHEYGLDDDGAAMDSYIESTDFDLGDGDQFMLTKRIIPDIDFSESTATAPEAYITLYAHRAPGSVYQTYPSDTKQVVANAALTEYTTQVFVRSRSRQMAMRVGSNTTGVQWQLGSCRLDTKPDGKR